MNTLTDLIKIIAMTVLYLTCGLLMFTYPSIAIILVLLLLLYNK